MLFIEWLGKNLLGIVALIGALFAPIVTIFQILRTTKVQLKQIRPQLVSHECRVCGMDIYTYFNEDNRTSEPACVYLASDNSRICMFDPGDRDDEKQQMVARRMKEINNEQCYLSAWGSKIAKI